MTEFTGYIEEEYNSDVEMDFSKWTEQDKKQLIQNVKNSGIHTFKEVELMFCGDVTIDVERDSYYQRGKMCYSKDQIKAIREYKEEKEAWEKWE